MEFVNIELMNNTIIVTGKPDSMRSYTDGTGVGLGTTTRGLLDINFKGEVLKSEREFTITAKDIERKLGTFKHDGDAARYSGRSADSAEFPPLALLFYKHLFENGDIPIEDEFVTACMQYFTEVADGEVQIETRHGPHYLTYASAYGRVLRSYASLVREFHFYLVLKESGYFDAVYYSLILDMKQGIDIVVTLNKQKFYIAVYTNSAESKEWADRKKSKQGKLAADMIRVMVERPDSVRDGEIYLSDELSLRYVQAEVENRLCA